MPVTTKLLHEMCALPTAAFLEDAVYAWVDRWLARRPELSLKSDAFGNRLILLRGAEARAPRLVLVAHTDHPAFVAGPTADDGTLTAEFRGGVTAANCRGARVRFYTPAGEVAATVRDVVIAADPTVRSTTIGDDRLKAATFRPKQAVPPGTIGMFDEGPPRERNGVFHSAACDDLAGCAAALTALDLLRRKPPRSSVAVLLTRAEEVGFVGAIAAVTGGKLLKKTDRIISIETSSVQPYAPQGKGVIVRVGDRLSVFHSAFSYYLAQRGEALSKAGKGFAFQRALMPGGACEGTVFDAFGHVAGAVCVALGNYHNMDRARGRTGPEFISVNDWWSMVALFVDAARHLHAFDGTHAALRAKLQERFTSHEHLFRDPAGPLQAS
jgi:endoglucanase